ncbi:hypothetical protein GOOTI_207_00010, partial [Gordonia otitidis NBRC 100426]
MGRETPDAHRDEIGAGPYSVPFPLSNTCIRPRMRSLRRTPIEGHTQRLWSTLQRQRVVVQSTRRQWKTTRLNPANMRRMHADFGG